MFLLEVNYPTTDRIKGRIIRISVAAVSFSGLTAFRRIAEVESPRYLLLAV